MKLEIPAEVQEFVERAGWGEVVAPRTVGGGDINETYQVATGRGPDLFLKINRSAPPDMFEREAEGLKALSVVDGPRVPTPLAFGTRFLLMEFLPSAPRAAEYWETFGRRLAAVHSHASPTFGFDHDNYIGCTPQLNPTESDGFRFFAEHRLLFQARLANERGLLGAEDVRRVERLAARLRELVPEQPASLVHGDLWSGNVLPGPDGHACLIDPAAHYGWAEADLAMTALFGRLPESFYSAYESVRPIPPGYRSRFDLYNVYHLLNHLNLFGLSYRGSVMQVLERY